MLKLEEFIRGRRIAEGLFSSTKCAVKTVFVYGGGCCASFLFFGFLSTVYNDNE